MASIDDLFRKPNAPISNATGKRKYEAPDAQEAYKSAKLSANEDVKGHANGSATVEDIEDEDDMEAGPELPPDEEEEENEADEEGRFFGGGVTKDTREAMDYLDDADEDNYIEEKIDAAWARRLATNLERKINKNAEQRARFESDPAKFMQSEADLDGEIKGLSILTEHAGFYAEFAKASGAALLVSLLAHDNADIAIGAVQTIAELLDEDVEVEQPQWDAMVAGMLEADLVNLIVQNFQRYDETENESDRQGVYHSLAVLESLGSQAVVATTAGTDEVFDYLLGRIKVDEAEITQNKQYAAEVLQVYIQDSSILRKRLLQRGAIDILLELLSPYRRRDPEDNSLEAEYAGNLFNALVCLVQEDEGKEAFVAGEGVELMLIMLREGKTSKAEALKILDHATVGKGQAVCERIVEAAGLKTIFALFKKQQDRQGTENLLDILSALLRLLPGESPERIRTLAKFAEKDFDKASKLVEWRRKFVTEVAKVDEQIARERSLASAEEQEELADEWDLRRLDAGYFGLQTVNIILAWLAAEDAGAARKIQSGLEGHGESLKVIRNGLEDQLADVDTSADNDLADMLKALIEALS